MHSGDSGSFSYANPPRIHWGAGCLAERLEQELADRGARRVFVVSTRSVATHPALGGVLDEHLGSRRVGQVATIGQHAPASAVAHAVRAAREADPDLVISFGGGSPIDAAKAITFALATDLDLTDPAAAQKARGFRPAAGEVLPHLAIPTTLSAAELSGLAGFTTEDEHEKVGLRGEALIPRAVILDAQLTLHTPLELWLSTGIRAVDHAVETLLAPGSHPFADTLALDALARLRSGLLATLAEPDDLAARTQSQLGAWFSFTLPGPAAAGLSHTLGKRIGARHGIPHGVTSCVLLPHVMRYLAPRTAAAQVRIAAAFGMDIHDMPMQRAAACAADAVANLIRALGLPDRLAPYGLTEADLESAANPVSNDTWPLEDLIGIYRAAL